MHNCCAARRMWLVLVIVTCGARAAMLSVLLARCAVMSGSSRREHYELCFNV